MNLIEKYLVAAKKELEWSVNEDTDVEYKQVAAIRGLTYAVMAAVIERASRVQTMNPDAIELLIEP